GCSRAVARATFGGQASVATVTGGSFGAAASTSPPPVWRSSAAWARPSRSAIARAYPPEGRSSVARPSSQEKSHPSTETASASATRASNRSREAVEAKEPEESAELAELEELEEFEEFEEFEGPEVRPEGAGADGSGIRESWQAVAGRANGFR